MIKSYDLNHFRFHFGLGGKDTDVSNIHLAKKELLNKV